MSTKFKLGLLLMFAGIVAIDSFGQADCAANAGGNAIICGTSTTLSGSVSGNVANVSPGWTFVSGPTTPVINSPNSLVTTVSDMTVNGDYTFVLSQLCNTDTARDTVVITAHPRPASFTAGTDITNICATVGTTVLAGNIPSGFTGEWQSINVYSYERFGSTVSTNSEFSSTTTAMPTFSLINKANHEIDPAYWNILKITSNDGVCSYEDTMTVSFIPNPHINPDTLTERCVSPTSSARYIFLSAPLFSTSYSGTAGVLSGTSITMNVISQPSGANISFNRMQDNNIFFDGATESGTYKFTFTVSNSCGTYTTPEITYKINGVTPHLVDFQPTGHGAPEQLAVYQTTGSGGEVHCNLAGTTTPENLYFSIDPADAASVITTISPTGIIPTGGAPTVTFTGAGTYNRVATVTPPAAGWHVGTYKFHFNTADAVSGCNISQTYFIHISDAVRPDVEVPDVSVCYPGTGAVSATIELPSVYQGVVDPSYFQDFDGHYDISLVSKPAGAANPTYTTDNLRSLTDSTTVISNLNTIGDYYFRIEPEAYVGSVGPFLNQEYACSGASMVDTFLVRVEGKINANAGSNQSLGCINLATLTGNATGAGTGLWTVAETPLGANVTFSSANTPQTNASGMNQSGTYKFAWNITTPYGGCTSSDSTTVQIANCFPAAGDDMDSTAKNVTINGVLSANDTCGNAPCTYQTTPASAPTNGTVTINADGTFSYVPDAGFSGVDSFQYVYCDADEECDTALVTVMVNDLNPVAVDDYYTVNDSDGIASGNVGDNDLLGDGSNTFTLLDSTQNGIIVFNPDGSFTYTVDSAYSGTDQFSYMLCDEEGDCDTATVSILIGTPTPVGLIHFDVKKLNNDAALLSWATSSEQDNSGFGVERSQNGTIWRQIGIVHSKAESGNSNIIVNYSFIDQTPEMGNNFYRLKQMDINGNYSYSEVRMVNFADGSSIRIHPNPAQENVIVSGLTGNRRIAVTNVLGQVVLRAQTNGEATKELHTAALTPGTYFITIIDEQNEKVTFRMIKE